MCSHATLAAIETLAALALTDLILVDLL